MSCAETSISRAKGIHSSLCSSASRVPFKYRSHVGQLRKTSPPDGTLLRLLPLIQVFLLVDAESEVRGDDGAETAETENPGYTVVARHTARLLQGAEDDGADQRGDDLGSGDGDVVDAEDHAGGVGVACISALRNGLLVFGGGLDGSAADGIALGDFRGDDREGCPTGETPRNADSANKNSRAHGGFDHECQAHQNGKEDVRDKPRATKGQRLDLKLIKRCVELLHLGLGGSSTLRPHREVTRTTHAMGSRGSKRCSRPDGSARCSRLRLWLWRLEGGWDDERKDDRAQEGCASEHQKGTGADSGRVLPDLVDFCVSHVRVRLEEWIRVDLANVSGDVEKEGEPADPGKELNLADTLDLIGKPGDGPIEAREESQYTFLLLSRRWVAGRITLASSAADANGEGHNKRGDSAKHLELGVTEPRKVEWEVDVSSQVTSNVSNTS